MMLHTRSSFEKPGVISMYNAKCLANVEKYIKSQSKYKQTLVSCNKTAEAIKTTKSEGGLFGG